MATDGEPSSSQTGTLAVGVRGNGHLHTTRFAQAINEFLTELKEEDDDSNPFLRELKSRNSTTDKATGPEEAQTPDSAASLRGFVQDKISQKRSERGFRILDRINPFIDTLSKLMSICEKVLEAAPFGVSIAFAGARIVLELALKMNDYMEAVVEAMEEIGISLKCYEKLADAYQTSEDVQELLVASYKKIIQYWYNVSGILSKNAFKRAMKSIATPLDKEFKRARDGLRHDGRMLSYLTQATTAQQTRQEREAEERRTIAKWISSDDPIDAKANLMEILDCHQKGTCQWMLEDPRLQSWIQAKDSQAILWYNAKPGSGKSVLAASVIQHLASRGKKVVHFFYSFNAPERKKGLNGLRCMALQLMRFSDTLPQELVETYKEEMYNQLGGIYSARTAVEVVHQLLSRCGEVYVVVDGLDECMDEEDTLKDFGRLLRMPTYGRVKWLFTSRDHTHIRSALEERHAVEVQAKASLVAEDVRTYLRERLPTGGALMDTFFELDEDNFLYAKLMCDVMQGEGATSVADIEDALNSYPKNLNGCFMRALGKLSATGSKVEQETARRVFLILIGAAQSVSLDEVRNLLAVTPEGKDFDPKRLPLVEKIKRLCSPLVVFGKARDGDAPENPVMTLCHKTVQDFFEQDPDDIEPDTGFTPELRKYFVTPARANERLGLDCLTYLQYARYQKSGLDLGRVLSTPVAVEHAFLRYAAAFWAQHLTCVPPSRGLDEAVQAFLRSPAFWTCLSVQARVVPYLFGRYCGWGGGTYKMSLRGSSRDNCFGLPLPDWLETYSRSGASLDKSLCSFVEEWREVLVTCPAGMELCPPLDQNQPSCHLTPSRKSKMIKVAHLEDHLQSVGSQAETNFLDLSFRGKTLWADLILTKAEGRVQRLQVPLFTGKQTKSDEHHLPIEPAEADGLLAAGWLASVVRATEAPDTLAAWKVDPNTLSLRRVTRDHSREQNPPLAFSKANVGRKKGFWSVAHAEDYLPKGSGARSTAIIHVVWISQRPPELSETLAVDEDTPSNSDSDDPETESEYSSSDSESDSDDDDTSSTAQHSVNNAKNETSNETSDTDYESEAEEEGGSITDCLIVAPFDGEARWYPWSRSGARRLWSRIICASHPDLPLLVMSHTARQIEVMDLEKGTREIKHLPERADLDEEPLASVRELRFSPCGNYLHFLSVSFSSSSSSSHQEQLQTEARITLSTFYFDRDGGADKTLLRECRAHRCDYAFGEVLADVGPPLCLTHWSGDHRDVLVALPPLTCDPRVVRIRLPEVDPATGLIAACYDDDDNGSGGGILTPREPVYFPTSTPARRPRLMYRGPQQHQQRAEGISEDGEAGGSCYLFLALDRLRHGKAPTRPTAGGASPPAESDAEPSSPERVSPPVVLRWKMASGDDGWRVWNPEEDGRASDLKRPIPVEKLLQGQFVDAAKRFNVPIRSGLNWSRKGHLSCATFM